MRWHKIFQHHLFCLNSLALSASLTLIGNKLRKMIRRIPDGVCVTSPTAFPNAFLSRGCGFWQMIRLIGLAIYQTSSMRWMEASCFLQFGWEPSFTAWTNCRLTWVETKALSQGCVLREWLVRYFPVAVREAIWMSLQTGLPVRN